jgi:hypothetical protein
VALTSVASAEVVVKDPKTGQLCDGAWNCEIEFEGEYDIAQTYQCEHYEYTMEVYSDGTFNVYDQSAYGGYCAVGPECEGAWATWPGIIDSFDEQSGVGAARMLPCFRVVGAGEEVQDEIDIEFVTGEGEGTSMDAPQQPFLGTTFEAEVSSVNISDYLIVEEVS